MTFDASCSRLRLGGSISGSTLSGGTVIDAGGIAIETWDGMLGHPGRRGENSPLLGTDGSYRQNEKPYRERLLILNFVAYDTDATGVVTLPDGRREHLQVNMDDILSLLDGAGETAILERDLADGAGGTVTRWIAIEMVNPASFQQGPIFDSVNGSYRLTAPVIAAYPLWQSETLHSDVAPATISATGNARIGNAVITATGAGTLTNSDDGYDLVTNAACVIDIGARTVTNGGLNTDGRLDPPERAWWMRFAPGANVVVPAGWTVEYRDQYL